MSILKIRIQNIYFFQSQKHHIFLLREYLTVSLDHLNYIQQKCPKYCGLSFFFSFCSHKLKFKSVP